MCRVAIKGKEKDKEKIKAQINRLENIGIVKLRVLDTIMGITIIMTYRKVDAYYMYKMKKECIRNLGYMWQVIISKN